MSDLVWCIKIGDIDQVKEVIDTNNINVNEIILGRLPLHYAADYGHALILEYLISKGAAVDVKDRHGITPILAAIWEGHTDCVKVLLKNGASKGNTAPDGTKYLDCADKQEIKDLLN